MKEKICPLIYDTKLGACHVCLKEGCMFYASQFVKDFDCCSLAIIPEMLYQLRKDIQKASAIIEEKV